VIPASFIAAQVVANEVRGDGLEPVVAGDEVVLPGEFALESFLLRLVEIGLLDEGFEIGIEIRVGELKLGDAVFVIGQCARSERRVP
jgi:hypothetical protein